MMRPPMLFTLAVCFCATAIAAAGIASPGARNDGDTVSPALAPFQGPLVIANFETELYLEHVLPGPNETGYPLRAVPYTASRAETLQWHTVWHPTYVGGEIYTIHTNRTWKLGVFVNSAAGNAPSVRVLATQFNLTELSPFKYRITIPLTTLALTAPDTAGSSPTLQPTEVGNRAQEWHFY